MRVIVATSLDWEKFEASLSLLLIKKTFVLFVFYVYITYVVFLHFHCLIVNIVSSICSLSFLFSAMCVLVLRYHMYGSDIGALGVYMGDLTVNGITSESRLQTLRRIPPSGTSPIRFISFDFLTLI